MGHMSESEVIEARVRLVVGLKRYFHGKRVEGLLSTAVSSLRHASLSAGASHLSSYPHHHKVLLMAVIVFYHLS